jgi:hypothetical protein
MINHFGCRAMIITNLWISLTITAQRFGPPLPHTLPHMIMTYCLKLSTTDFICGSVEALPSHAIKTKKGHSMKNITRHTGTLRIVKRMKNSYLGNPQFMVFVDESDEGHGVRFRTAANSSHAYGIENYEGQRVTVTVGTHYGCATLNTITSHKEEKHRAKWSADVRANLGL